MIWEDANRELVYQNVLYDIVSVKNENGKVILTVLSDSKEQEIKKQFAENFDELSSKSTGNTLKLLKQFLALKYVLNNGRFEFKNNPILNEYQAVLSLKLEPVFISTEIPPPDLFV